MKRKILSVLAFCLFSAMISSAQEALKYQLPPKEIVKIVDAPQTPQISLSPDKATILLLERALDVAVPVKA